MGCIVQQVKEVRCQGGVSYANVTPGCCYFLSVPAEALRFKLNLKAVCRLTSVDHLTPGLPQQVMRIYIIIYIYC